MVSGGSTGGGRGGGGGGGGGHSGINSYGSTSYVITIDGISTVFSNPMRLSGGGGANGGQQEGGLPATVQVITGDILSHEAKMTYDPEEDTKLPPEAHTFHQDKTGRAGHHAIYSVTSNTKGMSEGQAGREYAQQTGLLEQAGTLTQPTLDASIHGHGLGHKPKVE